MSLGQFQRGIEDLDEAIRLDPGDGGAYNNRGAAYGNLGRFQRAIQDVDEAIRLDPGNGLAYANRAVAHTFLNNGEAAQRDVERAIQLGFDEDQLNELIERSMRQR